MHVWLWHRDEIKQGKWNRDVAANSQTNNLKSSFKQITAQWCSQVGFWRLCLLYYSDTTNYSKLMRSYLPVPSVWYVGLLAVNFGAAGKCLAIFPYHDNIDWEQSHSGQNHFIADANMGSGVGNGHRHCKCSGANVKTMRRSSRYHRYFWFRRHFWIIGPEYSF